MREMVKHRKVGDMDIRIEDIVRKPYFIPDSKKINALFHDFRKKRVHIAAAVDEYGNLTSTAIIKVPKGCCFSLAVEYVQATDDPATEPTPFVLVQNSNLVIDRIA